MNLTDICDKTNRLGLIGSEMAQRGAGQKRGPLTAYRVGDTISDMSPRPINLRLSDQDAERLESAGEASDISAALLLAEAIFDAAARRLEVPRGPERQVSVRLPDAAVQTAKEAAAAAGRPMRSWIREVIFAADFEAIARRMAKSKRKQRP